MEASEPACMTPDQCFDEMAVALGVPKDTGYIDLLELVKELKQQNDNLEVEIKELKKVYDFGNSESDEEPDSP